MSVDPREKLIVALDLTDTERARELIELLSPLVKWFKVGSILFTKAGPQVCSMVKEGGLKLFLDLKFHDIPNTVGLAVRSALSLGADMLTVHAAGGRAMLAAASQARQEAGREDALVVAVTLLTHIDAADLGELFPGEYDCTNLVLRMAGTAVDAGVSGVVASAEELGPLRNALGPDPIIVTPGIRLEADGVDDQKRCATPEVALSSGADFLVVGRPIVGAKDPRRACQIFLDRMASVG